MKIGIVAIQGDFAAHAAMLETLGAETLEVRTVEDLVGCDGIVLATQVKNPPQESLGLLDMTVLRNGYGRQLASDVFFGDSTLKKDPLEMVFIRGPIIEEVGKGISVLARHEGKPALVERGNILAATFHPELTDDTTVHAHFLEMAGRG